MHRTNVSLGLALGLLGVIIFGGSLPATRISVAGLDPLFVTAARAAFAGLTALAALIVMRRRPPWTDVRPLFVCTFSLVLIFPLLSALALKTVPSAHGGVILALLPLTTAAAAFIFAGERPSPLFWLFAVLGSALVLAFVLRNGAVAIVAGDALLLVTVVIAAVGYAISGRLARHIPAWEVISWALVIGLPVALPAVFLLWPRDASAVPVSSWIALAYSTVMVQYVGYWAWNAGMALGGVARVGQMQLLQPFVTFVLAAIFLGERIDATMIGFAVAVVAVVALGRRAAIGVRAS